MTATTDRRPVWVAPALCLGGLAPLILAAVAIVGGALHPGYSHLQQAISELTAAGAPVKRPLDLALLAMELFTVAFGAGYWRSVRHGPAGLRASAGLMVFIGAVGVLFYRYPMDPVGSPMTADGRMHLAIVGVSAVAGLLAVASAMHGWRRTAGGRGIARLSALALAAMLASGVAAAVVGMAGWPGLGLWQRINTAAFGLWQIATAAILLVHGSVPARPARDA